jgi:hypothetical protein
VEWYIRGRRMEGRKERKLGGREEEDKGGREVRRKGEEEGSTFHFLLFLNLRLTSVQISMFSSTTGAPTTTEASSRRSWLACCWRYCPSLKVVSTSMKWMRKNACCTSTSRIFLT